MCHDKSGTERNRPRGVSPWAGYGPVPVRQPYYKYVVLVEMHTTTSHANFTAHNVYRLLKISSSMGICPCSRSYGTSSWKKYNRFTFKCVLWDTCNVIRILVYEIFCQHTCCPARIPDIFRTVNEQLN